MRTSDAEWLESQIGTFDKTRKANMALLEKRWMSDMQKLATALTVVTDKYQSAVSSAIKDYTTAAADVVTQKYTPEAEATLEKRRKALAKVVKACNAEQRVMVREICGL